MSQRKTKTPAWQWLLFLLSGIIIGSSLLRTLWHTYHSRQVLKQELESVNLLEENVEQLHKEVQEATSSFTLEKRARQELRLQQDGEIVIPVEN